MIISFTLRIVLQINSVSLLRMLFFGVYGTFEWNILERLADEVVGEVYIWSREN